MEDHKREMTDEERRAQEEAQAQAQTEEFGRQDAGMWAEGENRATRGGRAAFALVAGSYLLWTQNTTTVSTHFEWGRWVALSVVANFLIPLLIANLFFAQGVRRQYFHPYLPNQRLISWRLGWKWSPLPRLIGLGALMWALMLPLLWFVSRDGGTQIFYRSYFPLVYDARSWAWLLGTLVLYMACWEWFFRGFLLFTLAQGVGAGVAILIQAMMFGLAHAGKPPLEMASSFAGGLILGAVAWREKSFVPAFVAHTLIHITWAILILR